MADPSGTSVASKVAVDVLQRLAVAFAPLFRRLRSERVAAQDGVVRTDLDGKVFDETLARLAAPDTDDGWWRRAMTLIGHRAVASEPLRRPAVREWLAMPDVARDLKRLAAEKLYRSGSATLEPDPATICKFCDRTGENAASARSHIDLVVAVLVAGATAGLDGAAGLTLGAVRDVGNRLDELDASVRAGIDRVLEGGADGRLALSAGQEKHTEQAVEELRLLLARRCVLEPEENEREAACLAARVTDGDLRLASRAARASVLGWAARFAAPLDGGRFAAMRARLLEIEPRADTTIADALHREASGDLEGALRALRGREDTDARSAVFSLLLKAERQEDAFRWLGPLNELPPARLTAIGWRNLGAVLMELGRWNEAADVLRALPPELSEECPDLAYVTGLACAALVLPPSARAGLRYGVVNPIMGCLEGAEAAEAHAAALAALGRAATALRRVGLVERAGNAELCATKLRLMWPATREAEREAVAAKLSGASGTNDLVPLALDFGIPFDREAVERRLARAELLGPLGPVDLEARLALLQHGDPAELANYLDTHRETLARALEPSALARLTIEALARSGQLTRAAEALQGARDVLGDDFGRLSDMLSAMAGEDPVESLAARAHETGADIDLANLCAALEAKGNWGGLVEPARRLLSLIPSVRNARRVVAALQHTRAPDAEVLAVLDSHPDLVRIDPSLARARAQALLGTGRIVEGASAAANLQMRHDEEDDAALAANAAVLTGDWARLKVLAAHEWERRAERSPEHLVSVAQMCGDQDGEASLRLAEEAASRSSDAGVLLRAAGVAWRQGRDEMASGWVARASEASGPGGPVRAVDHAEMLETLRERAQQTGEVWTFLAAGRAPLHVVAPLLGVGLADLLLLPLRRNARETDGRRRTVVPVRHGSRPVAAPPATVRRPAADLTSLLLLAGIGGLDLLDHAFDSVMVPWSTMVALRQEAERLGHHQRSRVTSAQRIRLLQAAGTLTALPGAEPPPEARLAAEVGEELAILLCRAQRVGGRVVHPAVVHQVGTMMEEHADLGDYGPLILTTGQFADALQRRGALDREQHRRARAMLDRQDPGPAPGSPDLGGPLLLSSLAVAYLEPLGLLEALGRAGLTATLSPTVVTETAAIVEAEADARWAADALDQVRRWYARGLASGRVSVLPRRAELGGDGEDLGREGGTLRELLFAPEDCDGILVDDRFIGRHPTAERAGRSVPLFCVFDLLARLQAAGHLSSDRHWALRHGLRAGGAACAPLDPEELLHHLSASAGSPLVETAELRAIRENLTILRASPFIRLPEEAPYLDGLARAGCDVIRRIWADATMAPEAAAERADWVWEHVVVRGPEWWQHFPDDARPPGSVASLEGIVRHLVPLLVPAGPRQQAAVAWLERRVVGPLSHDPEAFDLMTQVAKARTLELVDAVRG